MEISSQLVHWFQHDTRSCRDHVPHLSKRVNLYDTPYNQCQYLNEFEIDLLSGWLSMTMLIHDQLDFEKKQAHSWILQSLAWGTPWKSGPKSESPSFSKKGIDYCSWLVHAGCCLLETEHFAIRRHICRYRQEATITGMMENRFCRWYSVTDHRGCLELLAHHWK